MIVIGNSIKVKVSEIHDNERFWMDGGWYVKFKKDFAYSCEKGQVVFCPENYIAEIEVEIEEEIKKPFKPAVVFGGWGESK